MNKSYTLHSICFSTLGALEAYIATNSLDVLLCNRELELSDSIKTSCRCIRLSEHDKEECIGEVYIYKYQRVDLLVRQLLSIVDVPEDKQVDGALLYGVYSPVGRCGKTSFALGVCNSFSGSFYIGMNHYIGTTEVDASMFAKAEQFFYQLTTHNVSILDTMREYCEQSTRGFGAVYGMKRFFDYRQVLATDFLWLREALMEASFINRVVVDMDAGVLDDLEVLSAFDQIYLPGLTDGYSNRLLRHFWYLLEEDDYRHLRDRIVSIEVPADTYDGEQMKDYVRRSVR